MDATEYAKPEKKIKKRCRSCWHTKPINYFHQSGGNMCKICKRASISQNRTSESGRAWRRFKDRVRAAQKMGVKEYFSPQDEEVVKSLFQYRCFNCGISENEHKQIHGQCLNIDHHWPLILGYPLTRSNAVVLCRCCNSTKGDKPPTQFYSKEQLEILKDQYGVV